MPTAPPVMTATFPVRSNSSAGAMWLTTPRQTWLSQVACFFVDPHLGTGRSRMPIDRSVPDVHLHIGDERRTSGAGGVHDHVWPVTGDVQGPVPLAGPTDVDAAVQAAREAFETWRTWTPSQRRDVLVR